MSANVAESSLSGVGQRPVLAATALAELRKDINRKLREARREMIAERRDGGDTYGLEWAEVALVDLQKQVNRILTARAASAGYLAGHRTFTVSELWGPYRCEEAGCDQRTFTIYLTHAEWATLPEESGPEAIQFILTNKLGDALCSKHRPPDNAWLDAATTALRQWEFLYREMAGDVVRAVERSYTAGIKICKQKH